MTSSKSLRLTAVCVFIAALFCDDIHADPLADPLDLLGEREPRSHNSGAVDIPKFRPNSDLDFLVPKILSRPIIDGQLDEDFWKEAAKLGNFVEVSPGDNVKPSVETEALFAYDEENLYVGFLCYDDHPEQIRATMTDRDNIGQDDFAGIMLDTFKDRQTSYEFFVNPHGIQFDQRRSKRGEDNSFDTVWYSEGRITSFGWTAELAIPFRSLRFPNSDEQQWGVHILRVRPRGSREQHSWAPISRDESCLFCQAGHLRGIRDVHGGKNLELLPYVISSADGGLVDSDDPSSNFDHRNPEFDGGLGVKYGLTPNLTVDATINPDFSQVESDAAQLSLNTTFALFFEEKRPFFLEGNDIFRTEVNAVYTRSINDPIAAGKLTGKTGKYTLGYIVARDDFSSYIVPFEDNSGLVLGGRSFSNILRVKRDLLTDSFVGLLVSDRRYTSGYSTNFGVDFDLRFKEKYQVGAQILGSYTEEPDDSTLSEDFGGDTFDGGKHTTDFDGETYAGLGVKTNFRRSARHWNSYTFFEDFSPTFRADNGFQPSNGYRIVGTWNGLLFRPNNRVVEMLEPGLGFGRKFDYDGNFKDEWFEPQFFLSFKKQTRIFVSHIWSNEVFRDIEVRGIRRVFAEVSSDFSQRLTGGAWIREGRSVFRRSDVPFLASERTASVWTTVKPTSQLRLEATYLFQVFAQLDDGPVVSHDDHKRYSLRGKLTYQFNKFLFLRLVTQYVKPSGGGGSLQVDPLLSFKLNPFTVFFLGSTHDIFDYQGENGFKETQRTFFLKFQYLFRV